MASQTFFQVVSEAVRFFEENGFVSVEQLQLWTDKIRRAALESLTPESVLNDELNRALSGIYKRLIDDGQILKTHPGVGRFTVDRLKPKLRAELDRRLMVSRNLIKLNRQQMIEKTTQRFAGWASSVPAGGSRAVDVKDTKDNIRKALTSLPFEERRCVIDQSHKFVSSLNEIIAVDGGAIAGKWSSQWRRRGYSYRVDHKERDQKVYAIRGNWALEKGFMKAGPDGYTDQITKPGEEVYCFPGDSKVPYAGLVEKAFRRWYDGELTEIVTSSGRTLRATPNHPILTSTGWKAIGSLNEGDDVIEISGELVKSLEENQYNGVASIAEIFGAIEENGIVETLNLRPTDFHGDGRQGDVDVVFPTRELTFDFMTEGAKSIDQFSLAEPNGAATGSGAFDQGFFAVLCTANSLVSVGHKRFLFLLGKLGHAVKASVHGIAKRNSSLFQALSNWSSRDSHAPRNGQYAFAGDVGRNDGASVQGKLVVSFEDSRPKIETVGVNPIPQGIAFDANDFGDFGDGLPFIAKIAHVVKVNRSRFSGHVFNLQTEKSWYVTEGIITHNCSCSYQFLYNLRDLPSDMITAAGDKSLAEVRAKIAAMRK